MKNIDPKFYFIGSGLLLLLIMVLFLEKFLFFIIITTLAILVALLLRVFEVLKYAGVELVTFSTIIVGAMFHNPFIGGLYAFTILITHLTLGDYYIGNYVAWVFPVYILLGVISGILGVNMAGNIGIIMIVGINLVNSFFTLIAESDRFGKELPYAIGNIIINIILFTQLFLPIMNLLS